MTSTITSALAAVAVVITAGGAGGCIPAELRTIKIPVDSGEVQVPGKQIVGTNPLLPDQVFPASAFSDALSSQLAQSFSTESVDKDAVDSMTLTAMNVTVQDAEEGGRQVKDLGFLTSATFYLGVDEEDRARVAFSADGVFDANPAPTTYDFETTGDELAAYVKGADPLQMTGDVVIADAPNFATTLVFTVELTVVVNPVGALNGGPSP